jgi:hypothetical protein
MMQQAPTVQPFMSLYTSLPVAQRRRLEAQAQAYIQALDRAIAQVLAPTIGRADGQFLVTDEIIPLYGVGPTPEAAMADYRSVVVEYYESLIEDAARLGHVLHNQLEVLQQVFTLVEQGA